DDDVVHPGGVDAAADLGVAGDEEGVAGAEGVVDAARQADVDVAVHAEGGRGRFQRLGPDRDGLDAGAVEDGDVAGHRAVAAVGAVEDVERVGRRRQGAVERRAVAQAEVDDHVGEQAPAVDVDVQVGVVVGEVEEQVLADDVGAVAVDGDAVLYLADGDG